MQNHQKKMGIINIGDSDSEGAQKKIILNNNLPILTKIMEIQKRKLRQIK